MVDWKALEEGISLGGVYTLENYIRNDRDGAFFAVLTGDGERLLAKLAPEENSEAERHFATWQRSRHLRHPHLLGLRDVGRTELAGNSYIYGVFEYPDDALAPALEQGPLSEAEARGVLEAVLSGLRYLHVQGLVHGAVDPDHIVAVGDNVKLATDGLRESDDLEGHPEDVRQLGELIHRLRTPEPLGGPLATIVHHATAADARQRWTLAEIAGMLESQPLVTAVAPAISEPEPSAATPVMPVPPEPDPQPVAAVAAMSPSTVPLVIAPVPLETPELTHSVASPVEPPMRAPARPAQRHAEAPAPRGFPKWIIAGLAILLLSILLFNVRRKPDAAPDVAPVTVTAPTAVTPAPPAATPAPPAPPRHIETTPASMPLSARGVWRVIAFTFRSRDMAAKKAKQIDDKWPDLHAMVFRPKEHRGYYLVALGDRMSREDATRLQSRARSRGLPRDTYVQNYDD